MTITDEMGNSVSTFQINQNGLGYFTLKPQSNKKYYAQFLANDNKKVKISLPEVEENGFVLSADSSNKENIRLMVLAKFTGNISRKNVHLSASSKGLVIIDSIIYLKDSINIVEISRKRLPNGISRVVLSDQSHTLLNERFIYNYPKEKARIIVNSNKQVYNAGENITLELETKNIVNSAITNFSISVLEDKNLFIKPNCPISSYFNFNSDFPDMGNYAINTDNLTETDFDNYLLSVSPEKYYWKEFPYNSSNSKYFVENKGYLLSGKIKNKITKQPVINECIFLASEDTLPNLNYCTSDSAGYFIFLLDKFYDNKKIYLSLYNSNINIFPIHGHSLWMHAQFLLYSGGAFSLRSFRE